MNTSPKKLTQSTADPNETISAKVQNVPSGSWYVSRSTMETHPVQQPKDIVPELVAANQEIAKLAIDALRHLGEKSAEIHKAGFSDSLEVVQSIVHDLTELAYAPEDDEEPEAVDDDTYADDEEKEYEQ